MITKSLFWLFLSIVNCILMHENLCSINTNTNTDTDTEIRIISKMYETV